MKRFDDWDIRLAEILADQSAGEWGITDCAMRVFSAIQATTGVDIGAPWRGTYNSQSAALRKMVEFGCRDIEEMMAKLALQYELKEVPTGKAQRGDVVVYDMPDGPSLGIVGMDGWRVSIAAPNGCLAVPLRKCRRAWRVG